MFFIYKNKSFYVYSGIIYFFKRLYAEYFLFCICYNLQLQGNEEECLRRQLTAVQLSEQSETRLQFTQDDDTPVAGSDATLQADTLPFPLPAYGSMFGTEDFTRRT